MPVPFLRALVVATVLVASAGLGATSASATHPCYQGQPPEECGHDYREPPPPDPDVTVGNADDGATVHLTPGQRVVVHLVPTRPGDLWQGPDRSADWLRLSQLSISDSGTTASLDAAGYPDYQQVPTPFSHGPITLTAATDTACAHDAVPCDYTPQTWSITVYVDVPANPARSRFDACTATSATATAGIELAQYAGGTVAVAQGDQLKATLTCAAGEVTVPRAGAELFRDGASLQLGGFWSGHFVALRTGDTSVDYDRDPRCAHEQNVNCSAVYSLPLPPTRVGVHVAAVDAACVDPLATSSAQVPFGRTIAVTGTATPGATVAVWFRKGATDPFSRRRSLVAGADGTFGTSYVADGDYAVYATAGRCTTPLVHTRVTPTISGPALVRKGSTVTLTVHAPPDGQVQISFRRAGATVFSGRRFGRTDARGLWTASYVADADYRYYATYTYYGGSDGLSYGQAAQRRSSLGLTQAR